MTQTLIANGNSNVKDFFGGDGTLFVAGPLFGGGGVKLQASIDGNLWIDCADLSGTVTTLVAPGVINFTMAPCKLRAVLSGATVAGTAQVITATALGTVTADGIAIATITSALINAGVPLAVPFAVSAGDIPAVWGPKARQALMDSVPVGISFSVAGAGASIILTANALVKAANDATLNLALATGTATGITAAPASANTTAGVASTVNLLLKIAKNTTI